MIGRLSEGPFGTVNILEKWQRKGAGLGSSRTKFLTNQSGIKERIISFWRPVVIKDGGQEKSMGGMESTQWRFKPFTIMETAVGSC